MSDWSGLLQALHSSLIDEAVERHPDPKPELGLPVRASSLGKPSPDCDRAFLIPISLDGNAGLALVAADAVFEKELKLKLPDFWAALLKRAPVEFERRKLSPRFGECVAISPGNPGAVEFKLPAALKPPTKVIWMPIRLQKGHAFFGIGI